VTIPLKPADPRGSPPEESDELRKLTAKVDADRKKLTNLGGVKRIVGVHSGKGGVGKTFLAVNIAYALAERGLDVGILDADVDCPNVPKFLGMTSRLFMDEEKHASRAFQKSFNLLVDRPKHIIRVWLFSMTLGLLLWIFVSGIGFFARNIQDMITSSTFVYMFSATIMLMAYLIKLTYDLWEHILLFRTYSVIKKSS